MAKPAHTRITVEGHIGASSTNVIERFSFSLNSVDDVAISGATDAALTAKAQTIHSAIFTQLVDVFPSNCWFDKTKIASVDAAGLYRVRGDGSYVKAEVADSFAGTQAASGMPLGVALCVSLVTARSGPTGKGRFFLPWPSLSLDTTTRLVPEAQINGLIDDVAAWLGDVNDVAGVNLAVVSSKGYTSDVTGIRIGRKPDTMRSRTEDLAEGYIAASVPQ